MFGLFKRRAKEALDDVVASSHSDVESASLEVTLVQLELHKLRHSLVQEIGKTIVSRLSVVLALNGAGLASTLALTKEIRALNPDYLGIPAACAVFFFVLSSAMAVRANASYKSVLPEISKEEVARFRKAAMKQPRRAKELAARYHAAQLHKNECENFGPTQRRLRWLNAASVVWLLGATCLIQLVSEWLSRSEPWYLHLL